MERHRHADQFGGHRVFCGRLGIDRDPALMPGDLNPAVECGLVGDGFVIVVVARRIVGQVGRGSGGRLGRGGRIDPGGRVAGQFGKQRPEPVMLQKRAKRRLGNALQLERIERIWQRHVARQFDQLARQPCGLGMFDQVVAHLRRLHRRRGGEHRFDIAMFEDQLGRGLRTDAGNAGDIVDAVAHQREHFAQFVGADAELFDHLGRAEALVLHRVEHVDVGLGEELHQVLVRTDDRHRPALCQRGLRIAGDQVVGFPAQLLDAGQTERPRRVADHRELGFQVLGRGRAVRLILVVKLVAERVLGLVEDDRQMGRPVRLVQVVGEFPQHGRIAIHRARRFAVLVGQLWQHMIGAEDETRSIDQVEMIGHRRGLASPARAREMRLGHMPA